MRPHSLASIVLIAAALQAPIAAAGDGVSTQPASNRVEMPKSGAVSRPAEPWGVELAGGPTPDSALRRYQELISKYAAGSILAGAEPHLVVKDRIGEMGAVRVRIDAETQAGGEQLCLALMAVGWYCEVFRN